MGKRGDIPSFRLLLALSFLLSLTLPRAAIMLEIRRNWTSSAAAASSSSSPSSCDGRVLKFRKKDPLWLYGVSRGRERGGMACRLPEIAWRIFKQQRDSRSRSSRKRGNPANCVWSVHIPFLRSLSKGSAVGMIVKPHWPSGTNLIRLGALFSLETRAELCLLSSHALS